MKSDCIPFNETGYFSNLICDYLDEKESLQPFYNRFSNLENFKEQILEKQANFPEENREVLHKAIKKQYANTDISRSSDLHIELLKDSSTFTVVTGHQLNLFTGPLYFLYKIISTINLTQQLKEVYPNYNFKGKKLQWNKKASGAVGHLTTEGLEDIYDMLSLEIGMGKNADELKALFKKAYLEHTNLTAATRYLANKLFGEYGLVIVDGDDKGLKKLLVPYAKKDIIENTAFKAVNVTSEKLGQLPENYGIQVNPREINYFYLKDGLRERIIEKNGSYYINDTDLKFTEKEILEELDKYPERFSPNVIARPLYQEVILPNLCYIGGGGELAYWLELKTSFEEMGVTFPILLLRNSALVITKKQGEKLNKLKLDIKDLFLKQSSFINKKIRSISNIDIDFSPQRKHLEEQFKELYSLAEQTDKSFLGAVKAQEVKQIKGLDNLEKRLLKAQKRKLKDHVVRMTEIQNELFPNKSLQERNLNFSELYLEYGNELIPNLMVALKPLSGDFTILTMDN